MIYLVGVDHRIQVIGGIDAGTTATFVNHLNEVIVREGVCVVAEEYSEDVLVKYRYELSQVVVRSVAITHGLHHIFIDPNTEERLAIGLPTDAEIKTMLGINTSWLTSTDADRLNSKKREYFPIREAFWLDRLRPFTQEGILCVCGNGHLESFGGMLIDRGVDATIVSRDWGKL